MSLKLQNVKDAAFKEYGRVVEGLDFKEFISVLTDTTEAPDHVIYVASDEKLEALAVVGKLQDNCYGGMPIQVGYCNGTNTKLNCLEYHKDSEINIAADNAVLLVARLQDASDGPIDSSKVEAFLLPAGWRWNCTRPHCTMRRAAERRGSRSALRLCCLGGRTDQNLRLPV